MKKRTLLASLLAGAFLCFGSASYAQYHSGSSGGSGDGAFETGNNIIGVGVGFGGGLSSYSYIGGWTSSTSPGFMLSFEHSINEHWGLGAALTYATSSWTSPLETDYNPNTGAPVTYTEKWKFTAIGVIIRGAYHFTVSPKFDPYVGIGLGYFDFSSSYSNNDPYAGNSLFYYTPASISLGGVAFTAYAGARYYFSSNIGIWAELGYTGYAGNLINLGLNFKF